MALQPKQIIDAIQALLLVNSCINLTQIFKSQTGRTEKRDKWVKIEKKKKLGVKPTRNPLSLPERLLPFFNRQFLLFCFLAFSYWTFYVKKKLTVLFKTQLNNKVMRIKKNDSLLRKILIINQFLLFSSIGNAQQTEKSVENLFTDERSTELFE